MSGRERICGSLHSPMPRSYRMPHVTAIALTVAVITVVQGLNDGACGASRADHHQNVPSTNASPQPLIPAGTQHDIQSLAASLSAINARDNAATKRTYDDEYLQSQKDMAWNAGCMFWVGFVELLITAVGVFLVALTLRAANRSAIAAEGVLKE